MKDITMSTHTPATPSVKVSNKSLVPWPLVIMDEARKRKPQATRHNSVPKGVGVVIKELMFKFLVIGDFGVGKTAIVRRYVDGRFSSNYKITIGADFSLKTIVWNNRTRINLQLWDIAGHERFGYMTRVYYKYAVAAVVVFDLTRSATTHSVIKWLKDLREKVQLPDGSAVPLVLLANKCDVDSCIVPTELINRLCKDYQIDAWFVTSAKENTNIDDAFMFLVERSLQMMSHCSVDNENIVLNDKPIFDRKVYEKQLFCCQHT